MLSRIASGFQTPISIIADPLCFFPSLEFPFFGNLKLGSDDFTGSSTIDGSFSIFSTGGISIFSSVGAAIMAHAAVFRFQPKRRGAQRKSKKKKKFETQTSRKAKSKRKIEAKN